MADEKTPEQIEEERIAAEKAEADKDKKKKAKFTPEQVEHINDLYNKAFKDGAAKVEEALQTKLAEEKAEREKLAKQLEDLQKAQKPKEEPKTNPELEQVKAQMEEMRGILTGIKTERDELKKHVETAQDQARKSRKKDAFLNALKEADVTFFDPLEAYDLAEREGYEWDKEADRPVVLNKETNRPKLNENGEPMNVIDFVKSFAEKKKYLVKATTQDGGTGSSSQRKHEPEKKTGDLPDFAKMTNEEFDAYTQRIIAGQR